MYSVFIPFLAKSKCIQQCLNALHENSVHPHEIVCTIGETDVYYAFNEGVYKCKHDTVVLLSDDMIVSPGWDRLIPQYARSDTFLTTYVYEPMSVGLHLGPSTIKQDFGGIYDFQKAEFETFVTEQSRITPDIVPNVSGWYMPLIVNKKTFITYPNIVKFPYCANDFLLFNMVNECGADYKFGIINSHVYHFGHASYTKHYRKKENL
jgi:hypothetical protein